MAEQQSHMRQREIDRFEEAARTLDACYQAVRSPMNYVSDARSDKWRGQLAQIVFRVDQQNYLMKAYGTQEVSDAYELVHDRFLAWGLRENQRAPDDERAPTGQLLEAIGNARRALETALKQI